MGTTNLDALALGGAPVLPGGGGLPFGRRYFFVDSAFGSNSYEGTMERPFSTLDFALSKCTANYGDVIVLMPNHSETITGAGGINFDIAGVTVVGIGRGGNRPSFLMDGGTTVTALVSAADVTVRNIEFRAGHADIVTCFGITATGAWLDQLYFVNHVVNENFVTEIKATGAANTADGLWVTNCRAITVDSAGAEFIEVTDDQDSWVLRNNFVCKDAGTAAKFVLCATGKDLTNIDACYNLLVSGATAGDTLFDNDTTANSGIVAYNAIGAHDVDAAVPVDLSGARCIENYQISVDDASALLLPAVDDNA